MAVTPIIIFTLLSCSVSLVQGEGLGRTPSKAKSIATGTGVAKGTTIVIRRTPRSSLSESSFSFIGTHLYPVSTELSNTRHLIHPFLSTSSSSLGRLRRSLSCAFPPRYTLDGSKHCSRRAINQCCQRRGSGVLVQMSEKKNTMESSAQQPPAVLVPSTISSQESKVLVVGSANHDLISYTNRLPNATETLMGSSFETCCGGKGANQAVAAASLDVASNVEMICKVGRDTFGDSLLENFRRVGVEYNEEHVYSPTGVSTGVAQIVVDENGENFIVVVPGANHDLSPQDIRDAMLSGDIAPPKVVVVQLEVKLETALEALKCGKEMGAITILNPAPAPSSDDGLPDEFYDFADIVIPNQSELRILAGSVSSSFRGNDGEYEKEDEEEHMAKSLLRDKGVRKAVIVTLGPRGAMIVERKSTRVKEDGEEVSRTVSKSATATIATTTAIVQADPDLPCHSEPVVDTVGAGDAFCGALAAYLSVGLPLNDAATMACGVAGMSVRKKGAQSSYPLSHELPHSLRVNAAAPSPPPPSFASVGVEEEEDEVSSVKRPSNEETRFPITFVTGNEKKLLEVQRLLSSDDSGTFPFVIRSEAMDIPEYQGENINDIAREKCILASSNLSGGAAGGVFTEDTSLSFHALNGLPGPYIKWFLQRCGHDGLNDMLDGFQRKEEEDHDNTHGSSDHNAKLAYAETVIAFHPPRRSASTAGAAAPASKADDVILFHGKTEGRIVRPRGSLDFGWDAIFEPLEQEGEGVSNSHARKTYAEMTMEEKNAISHRGRAFAKFRNYLINTAI